MKKIFRVQAAVFWLVIVATVLISGVAAASWPIYLTLALMLAIAEWFPIPMGSGQTTLSFPIIYCMYLFDGTGITALTLSSILVIVAIYYKRPWHMAFLNGAQAGFSFLCAAWCVSVLELQNVSPLWENLIQLALFSLVFFIISHLSYDYLYLFKKVQIPIKKWQRAIYGDGMITLMTTAYSAILVYFIAIGRGVGDFLTYFFFLSPVVSLSVVSSFLMRLKDERHRMGMLFMLTHDLNQWLTSVNWLEKVIERLQNVADINASLLWVNYGDYWEIKEIYGMVNDEEVQKRLKVKEVMVPKEIQMLHFDEKLQNYYANIFQPEIKSIACVPLLMNQQIMGLWVFGSKEALTYNKSDIESMKAFADQLAIAIKTKQLIRKQENHRILEERNRIAREIHDGIAQTVAGAVMNLETAKKNFNERPLQAYQLLSDNLDKLRLSLKEIRSSIYALRPSETKKVGLVEALRRHIEGFKAENAGMTIDFHVNGEEKNVNYNAEKTAFEIAKESLQNINKHAAATRAEINLKYSKKALQLTIKDNGVGFSLFRAISRPGQKQPHFGLINMNEEAEKIGATLQIDSKEGQGTQIRLLVPTYEKESGDTNDKSNAR